MANLNSLMSGGWEPDNNMDFASNYELAMEYAEAKNPELFRVVWEPCQPCSVSIADNMLVEADELPF